jgi:ribonuclease/clavin/mitogillin
MRPRELSRSIALFAARTPTLPPATHTNSYALGTREVLLVEPATPYADEQREWIAWGRALAASGRRLVAIVATHHHPDHVGGVHELTRALDVPLWAHAETASRVDVPVARVLEDDDSIRLDGAVPEVWKVMHTPGHAPGHVCLWNADERAVVVGDMVASVGTILIDPVDGDMRAYLEQLDRLARLDARLALPAHGEPIDRPTELFRHYIAHRQRREAKIVAVLASRRAAGSIAPTAEEILPDAYDDVPATSWPIALLSLRAHLKKLDDDRRASPS